MALLIRWLHPDQNNGAERSVFVARVTRAWNELKNEDRRAAYDLDRRRELSKRAPQQLKRSQKRSASRTVKRYERSETTPRATETPDDDPVWRESALTLHTARPSRRISTAAAASGGTCALILHCSNCKRRQQSRLHPYRRTHYHRLGDTCWLGLSSLKAWWPISPTPIRR